MSWLDEPVRVYVLLSLCLLLILIANGVGAGFKIDFHGSSQGRCGRICHEKLAINSSHSSYCAVLLMLFSRDTSLSAPSLHPYDRGTH